MSIIEQAVEEVSDVTPKMLDALANIKFLLITVPIACVLLGLATQTVTTERNVGLIKFEMGSFATPDRPNQVPLAEPEQVKVRIRQHSREIRDKYPKSVVISTILEDDIVIITGTAKGEDQTLKYLSALAQKEMDFQNDRLEKMKQVQSQRMEMLRSNLDKFKQQRDTLESQFKQSSDPIALLALQQGIDSASMRISSTQKELDSYAVLNASDLFVDSTQVILEPMMIASSKWYRPLIGGAIGLGVGLLITLIIAIIAMVVSLSSRKATEEEGRAEGG